MTSPVLNPAGETVGKLRVDVGIAFTLQVICVVAEFEVEVCYGIEVIDIHRHKCGSAQAMPST